MAKHVIECKMGRRQMPDINIDDPNTSMLELQLINNEYFNFGIQNTINQLRNAHIMPSENGFDLLVLASVIYCADTKISRKTESQDSWTREIEIHLPVYNSQLWNTISPQLIRVLNFLTGDKWSLVFNTRSYDLTQIFMPQQAVIDTTFSSICLFSGGLDSFIGVIDLLEVGEKPFLISHSSKDNIPASYQAKCLSKLKEEYGDDCTEQLKSIISFPAKTFEGIPRENSERSRSFLFFSLAAVVASGLAGKPIYVPENGLISLNVPLDHLRLGSLSTRTTHPFLIARINEIFECLDIDSRLVNTYQFKTKGEMVRECRNQEFLAANISNTMSCSSPNKVKRAGCGINHCGYCVPCIIRQASLVNWNYEDTTYYWKNIHERVLSSTRAEGDNVRSFQYALSKLNNNYERAKILIHKAGPLNDYLNELDDFAGLYLRGMQEVENILNGVVTKPDAR